MSLQLKYTDENGILHINMSPPASSPRLDQHTNRAEQKTDISNKNDINYPNFDTINKRFSHYDIFGGKYDVEYDSSIQDGAGAQDVGAQDGGGRASEARSLFRSRYNSVEEELANTPYAFATERSFQSSKIRINDNPILDVTIESGFKNESPSKDLENNGFFSSNRALNLQKDDGFFGPQVDFKVLSKSPDSPEGQPAFSVTQLVHAQDRYFDLSSKQPNLRTTGVAESQNVPFSSIRIESPSKIIKSVIKNSSDVKNSAAKTDSEVSDFRRNRTPGKSESILKSEVKKDVKLKSGGEARAPVSPRVVRPGQRTVHIVERPPGGKRAESDSSLGGQEAFRVLPGGREAEADTSSCGQAVPISKRKRESSFAIIAETPTSSRPGSPRSLPIETRTGRTSPFRGRGFREETSRHTTPITSRANSPLTRRTNSLSRLDMAQVVALPPINLSRPHSPRNYIKQNIEEIREISAFNRDRNMAEAEQKKREEEEALLKEMGLLDKNANETSQKLRSRSSSPSKINLRSRSNSPSAILHYEQISKDSNDFVNPDDALGKQVTHKSRMSLSRSQPESNNGSPNHSKIPKRQNSVSPTRTNNRTPKTSNLNNSQRFISNSTSSIQESIKVGGEQRKGMSKSSQNLNISPSILKSKPPISPGKIGPPPTNKYVNPKRLSPIVGTPNKSPTEDKFSKPASAKSSPKVPGNNVPKKPNKTAGNTPSVSKVASRNASRVSSREQSPEKKGKSASKTSSARNGKLETEKSGSNKTSTIKRTPSRPTTTKPSLPAKPEAKTPVSRVNSQRNLSRTNSTKTLIEKQESQKKKDAKKDDKTGSLQDVSAKSEALKATASKSDINNELKDDISKISKESGNDTLHEKDKQDNETQYDKGLTKENGEHLVPLTKMSVVSMTTAAITSQPLDVVTKVTNQLPAALEKARDKAMLERMGSTDSILGKGEDNDLKSATLEKKSSKSSLSSIKEGDNMKLKLLQPPFNNPQVQKAKQKIDDILKNPEVSAENILNSVGKEANPIKDTMRSMAITAKKDIKDAATEIKEEIKIDKIPDVKDYIMKQTQRTTDEIRMEATKIVNSIMTPVEDNIIKAKEAEKKIFSKNIIEPVVTIVNERPKKPETTDIVEKMTEVIQGEADVEVQSSNVKPPEVDKMAVQSKMADGSGSDKSSYSNGGLPKSTSTTPRPIPPARAPKPAPREAPNKEEHPIQQPDDLQAETKKKNLCQRLMGKCSNKCSCCGRKQSEEEVKRGVSKLETSNTEEQENGKKEQKTGVLGKFSCCKKKASIEEEKVEKAAETGAGKANTIEFENESTKRKRGLSDILCGCCKRKHRIGDSTGDVRRPPTNRGGCCGRLACWKRNENAEDMAMRRDSILSDQPPSGCCNNRACNWVRGLCCGRRAAEPPGSRRQSMFSKNKSLSPTLPVEDTRKKLDTSLVEHTSSMKGAIPVLPISLAYFCLICNILVPGLGTVLSGLLCLCFGIPRFGIHDGLKPRIGSLLINIAVGAAQLFTVLFCLVGWGWSIWWGTIMLKVSRKYRKIRDTAAADEEQAPPVTSNNHHARA